MRLFDSFGTTMLQTTGHPSHSFTRYCRRGGIPLCRDSLNVASEGLGRGSRAGYRSVVPDPRRPNHVSVHATAVE